jgi:hypothetical protein
LIVAVVRSQGDINVTNPTDDVDVIS